MARFQSKFPKLSQAAKAVLAEFIGTFYLVLIIALTTAGGTAPTPGRDHNDDSHAHGYYGWSGNAPLAIGFGAVSLIFMYAHVGGGQFNPAVSVSMWMAETIEGRQLGYNIFAQIAGAFCGAFLALGLLPSNQLYPQLVPEENSSGRIRALFAEMFFTFAVCSAVIHVTSLRRNVDRENSFYGLAIGAMIAAAGYSVGGICGGVSFNPAVTLGLDMAALGSTAHEPSKPISYCWLYFIGETLGCALACLVFHFFDGDHEVYQVVG